MGWLSEKNEQRKKATKKVTKAVKGINPVDALLGPIAGKMGGAAGVDEPSGP